MSERPQSYESHAKTVPGYHIGATVLVVLPTAYFVVLAVTDLSLERVAFAAFCVGVVVLGLFARLFPLGVQDRVIRLEERLRMEKLLPDELKPRIEEISTDQLVGLRFASDDELEGLVRKALDGELRDRKAIKQAVRGWRPDHQRI